jgi:hypothetical protein
MSLVLLFCTAAEVKAVVPCNAVGTSRSIALTDCLGAVFYGFSGRD